MFHNYRASAITMIKRPPPPGAKETPPLNKLPPSGGVSLLGGFQIKIPEDQTTLKIDRKNPPPPGGVSSSSLGGFPIKNPEENDHHEGTGTRPDCLVNRAEKKIEGPFGGKICTKIEK